MTDGLGPLDNSQRHRLMQVYNWLNFKACMAVGTWGLVILTVLVVWVREAR